MIEDIETDLRKALRHQALCVPEEAVTMRSSPGEPEGLTGTGSGSRVSRDLNVEATILSSAAPGRLHSARPVTSGFIGLVARRCTMVVNPRHHLNQRPLASNSTTGGRRPQGGDQLMVLPMPHNPIEYRSPKAELQPIETPGKEAPEARERSPLRTFSSALECPDRSGLEVVGAVDIAPYRSPRPRPGPNRMAPLCVIVTPLVRSSRKRQIPHGQMALSARTATRAPAVRRPLERHKRVVGGLGHQAAGGRPSRHFTVRSRDRSSGYIIWPQGLRAPELIRLQLFAAR